MIEMQHHLYCYFVLLASNAINDIQFISCLYVRVLVLNFNIMMSNSFTDSASLCRIPD